MTLVRASTVTVPTDERKTTVSPDMRVL